MRVVATAPIPGIIMPSFPVAGWVGAAGWVAEEVLDMLGDPYSALNFRDTAFPGCCEARNSSMGQVAKGRKCMTDIGLRQR